MSRPLYKTTIVIWTEFDNSSEGYFGGSLESLAREAYDGSAYCSKIKKRLVKEPERDRDWDGTEFFEEINPDE